MLSSRPACNNGDNQQSGALRAGPASYCGKLRKALKAATENAIKLIKATLETDGDLCSDDCLRRKSLELAAYTQPEAIDEKHSEMMKILKR